MALIYSCYKRAQVQTVMLSPLNVIQKQLLSHIDSCSGCCLEPCLHYRTLWREGIMQIDTKWYLFYSHVWSCTWYGSSRHQQHVWIEVQIQARHLVQWPINPWESSCCILLFPLRKREHKLSEWPSNGRATCWSQNNPWEHLGDRHDQAWGYPRRSKSYFGFTRGLEGDGRQKQGILDESIGPCSWYWQSYQAIWDR